MSFKTLLVAALAASAAAAPRQHAPAPGKSYVKDKTQERRAVKSPSPRPSPASASPPPGPPPGPPPAGGPAPAGSPTPIPMVSPGPSPCNGDKSWLSPTQQEWNQTGTDQFIQAWMAENKQSFGQVNGGFTGSFSNWALGEPQVTCRLDGSTDCNFDDVCSNPQFLQLGNDTLQAYNTLQGMQHLRSYMQGLQTSYQEAALLGALQTDDWVETFYTQPNGKNGDDSSKQGIEGLLEALNAVTTIFSVAMAFIAPETIPLIAAEDAATVGIAKGAASALFGGAMSAGTTAFTQSGGDTSPDNFKVASDVGKNIGNVVEASLQNLVQNNDILMGGGTVNLTGVNGTKTADISNYLQGGAFANASINEADAMTGINTMLQSIAINQMWRQNKIFILGGGKCGDGQGIGSGPNETWCDPATNTAWYLYFWQLDPNSIVLNHHKWGWVTAPPGSSQLGQGEYANITVANVIESSVRAYQVAEYNYTVDVMQERMGDAVTHGWANPMADGGAWEGLFTIPVCNVSWAVDNNQLPGKPYILEPYNGEESRLQWCAPICDNNLQKTKLFINATNMENFQSPSHYCPNDPGYSTLN